jgi:hypothetical protein
MKRFLLGLSASILLWLSFLSSTFAAVQDPFVLIPEAKDEEFYENVDKLTDPNTDEGKEFRNAYNSIWDEYATSDDSSPQFWCDLGAMLSSGIVTWDTILCLLVRIVKFVANMALIVGSAMIIYAGYLYTITAMSGVSVDETWKANDAIRNAAIGIVIVVFSYAIQRIVTQAFLS